jgi:hypothetical protein
VPLELQELREILDQLVQMGPRVCKVSREHRELKASRAILGPMGRPVLKGIRETPGPRGAQETMLHLTA